jgi:hypothetical protein
MRSPGPPGKFHLWAAGTSPREKVPRGERERCAQMQMAETLLLVLIAVKAIVEIALHLAKH